MESVKSKSRKKDSGAITTERLSLRKEEQDKLDSWVQELNTKFDGMIRLTKSDLANFLIRHHPAKLSNEELALIEREHFDEVRWINWALAKIRDAKKRGQSLTLEELMEQRNMPSMPTRKTRRKTAPESAHDEIPMTPSASSLDIKLADESQT